MLNLAKPVQSGGDEVVHLFGVGDVGCYHQCFPAQVYHFLGGALNGSSPPAGQGQSYWPGS